MSENVSGVALIDLSEDTVPKVNLAIFQKSEPSLKKKYLTYKENYVTKKDKPMAKNDKSILPTFATKVVEFMIDMIKGGYDNYLSDEPYYGSSYGSSYSSPYSSSYGFSYGSRGSSSKKVGYQKSQPRFKTQKSSDILNDIKYDIYKEVASTVIEKTSDWLYVNHPQTYDRVTDFIEGAFEVASVIFFFVVGLGLLCVLIQECCK